MFRLEPGKEWRFLTETGTHTLFARMLELVEPTCLGAGAGAFLGSALVGLCLLARVGSCNPCPLIFFRLSVQFPGLSEYFTKGTRNSMI